MICEITRHNRYQYRHLTTVTDGDPRGGWVLQAVEMDLYKKWPKFTDR